MPEQGTVEKRRHARQERKFLIRFRVIGGALARDFADRVGQVVNVSQGGILFLTKRPLPTGTLVDLKFPESALGGAPRIVQGMVRRASPETKEGDYPVGLAFVRVNPPSRSASAGPAAASARPAAPKSPGERRRAARTPQRMLLKIKCVSKGLFEEFEPRGAMLVNISESGLEISTSRDYSPGSVLEIHIPENPMGPARKLRGAVAWTRAAEKEGHFKLGVALQVQGPGTRVPGRPQAN
jgi:hypothetical protein